MAAGDVGNMKDLGIFESYKSKLSQICSAAEAAEQVSTFQGDSAEAIFLDCES